MGDRDIETERKENGEGGGAADRKEGRGDGCGMEWEDKAVMGQGDKGEEKTNPRVIVKARPPRSTTLSDGS